MREIKTRDETRAWMGSGGCIIQASLYVNERYLYIIARKRNIETSVNRRKASRRAKKTHYPLTKPKSFEFDNKTLNK
jgi:hypothetical protein